LDCFVPALAAGADGVDEVFCGAAFGEFAKLAIEIVVSSTSRSVEFMASLLCARCRYVRRVV
jgi:hypothetical protein